MQKYLKNNIVIMSVLFVSCLLLTFLFYLKGLVLPIFISFTGNILIFVLSIVGVVLCNSLFMFATDSIFCKKIKFKERFFYVTKSLWMSQCLLLPIVLILCIVNCFINLSIDFINNVIVISISYLSQLILFITYKFVTKNTWVITIKVVSLQFALMSLLNLLLKFI